MPTNFKKLCITTILFCFTVSSQLLAIPLKVLNDPDFILPIDRKPTDNSKVIRSTALTSANPYKSGDSVSFVCSELMFTTATGAGSDCWGWVDSSGTEYAIYASWNAIEFYNLETASLAGSIPAPAGTWHDIKTYQNYCYAVSEATGTNDGLLIIDMQYLPDSVHYVNSIPTNGSGGQRTSHNLSIDTVQGYAYIEGTSSANQSLHIQDLSNPESPSYVGSFGPSGGLHDIFCYNDTLYMAEGVNPSFSIWNMANKNSPELLTRVTIPNAGYVHNIWPTGDKRHVLTTEETGGKTIKLWNIEDLQNVQLKDEYLGPSNLAHNALIVGDTAYVSHYESGVIVLDLSNPDSIVELSQFDTYPASENSNYNGCWGVYPNTPSGRFYASNIEGQLYVLKEFNVVLADTLIALDAQSLPGSSVRIDIWAKFTLDMHEFEIPFNWNGPFNLSYDSISTAGLLTEYFEVQQLSAYDALNKRAAVLLRASNGNSSPDLPVGEGVIISLFFTIPDGASGSSNPITFTPFNGKEATFKNLCINYSPDTLSGAITLGEPPCCIGIRGNVNGSFEDPPTDNGIDIADLVALVNSMFQGGPAPPCDEEADFNSSGTIDISDLVGLAAFIFQNGAAPSACP